MCAADVSAADIPREAFEVRYAPQAQGRRSASLSPLRPFLSPRRSLPFCCVWTRPVRQASPPIGLGSCPRPINPTALLFLTNPRAGVCEATPAVVYSSFLILDDFGALWTKSISRSNRGACARLPRTPTPSPNGVCWYWPSATTAGSDGARGQRTSFNCWRSITRSRPAATTAVIPAS